MTWVDRKGGTAVRSPALSCPRRHRHRSTIIDKSTIYNERFYIFASTLFRDVLPPLPLALFRPPQAVALPLVPACKLGGTEGREPSLHVDAFASTLRPLSPYGPVKRGLPSFPRFSALRFCSSSVRRGILCRGIGGQRAWQPSLRSGRLRRPARAERDNSRRRTPCPQCRAVASKAGGSLLVVSSFSHPWQRALALVDRDAFGDL